VELVPGTILLGKYRVDDLIGTGGMGRVVRASHLYLQQSVAIKVLLPEMAGSASTVARFLREAQSTARLKSEHIARVIDVGTMPDGTPFMVMEYLEGNDLNQILRHHGPQLPAIVCDLMLQACEGIAEAHAQGIIHRDIKPSNFFITQQPDGSMLLKILDFGISKTPVGYDDLTGTQTVMGTPSYMAPEQMKSGRHADARSDIWSIAIVMYQMLCGRPPFVGESYADLVLKVGTEPPEPIHVAMPAGLGDVILRCLEKDPQRRPQNVGELARSLAPYATDPLSAAQMAARATRILTARISAHSHAGQVGQQVMPLSAGGGLATPVPISPAQLTPRSWPPNTSQSHGRGQVTYKVAERKGWLIAGVASVLILAGTGGLIVSKIASKNSAPHRDEPHVEAPPPMTVVPPGPPAPPAATATPPTPPPSQPTPADVPKGDVAKAEATKSTVVATPKTATVKTATATVATPKTTTKATQKPVAKKPKHDDLFDSRH